GVGFAVGLEIEQCRVGNAAGKGDHSGTVEELQQLADLGRAHFSPAARKRVIVQTIGHLSFQYSGHNQLRWLTMEKSSSPALLQNASGRQRGITDWSR